MLMFVFLPWRVWIVGFLVVQKLQGPAFVVVVVWILSPWVWFLLVGFWCSLFVMFPSVGLWWGLLGFGAAVLGPEFVGFGYGFSAIFGC
jgi:hypothetical protein